MKIFLNKLIVTGAKSIDKPIELIFSNITITPNMNLNNSNVKAIYGPNGSGKSGIVSAMYIYKKLLTDNDGLNDKLFSKFIYEIINKKNKHLEISVFFTVFDLFFDNKVYTVRHYLKIKSEDEFSSVIQQEKIDILKGKSLNDNFQNIFSSMNGMIDNFLMEKEDIKDEPLYMNSMNLLDKHPLLYSYLKTINSLKEKQDAYLMDDQVFYALTSLLLFTNNLVVELNEEDMHSDYISNKFYEKTFSDEENINKKLSILKNNINVKEYLFNLSIKNADEVLDTDYPKYEENIKKLTSFLKIFKPSLDEIIIDKKINDNKYYCKKIFRYGDVKIDIEFESTGIKKLVKLYQTMKLCANGKIAFIDEMDANLHDVYFTKIIEFFKNDSNGQLCFTTHNLEPIDILKGNSHSLDFISNDSRIYSWVKDGNKSPMNKYVNGLIPYSPFNIESFDFDILLDEE